MSHVSRIVVAVAAGSLLLSAHSTAQHRNLVNAQVRTLKAGPSLERDIDTVRRSTTSPAWIGYEVPAVPGERHMCCWDGAVAVGTGSADSCGGCRLEEGRSGATGTATRPVALEGPRAILVLVRVEQQRIGKLRIFSEDCVLDAGGLPVHWLEGVRPAESIAWLKERTVEAYATTRPSSDPPPLRNALTALALHADAAATTVLEDLAAASRPLPLRRQAAFWLGSARGKDGFSILQGWLARDQDARFRREVTFAVSVSREPGVADALIRSAREDASGDVRGQALFWLAQRAGVAAAAAIKGAIENDPDTEVKKRAVFAVSRLPKDEGIPLLIELARSHKNPEVRKQACFWLGQSKDPRALAYFEQVLTR